MHIAPAFPVFSPFCTNRLLVAAIIALKTVYRCLRELDVVCGIPKRRNLVNAGTQICRLASIASLSNIVDVQAIVALTSAKNRSSKSPAQWTLVCKPGSLE